MCSHKLPACHQHTFYTTYVDDILVIYDCTLTAPDSIQWYLSTIHNNIQLNPTPKNNLSISFLDLTITRKPSHLDIGIHRKPTTTETTIHFLSNHPHEHKLAAYRFLIRRMLTLPIHKEQRHEEWQNILHIAHRNNFPRNLITNLKHRIKKKLTQPTHPTTSRHDTKWTTFTYTSPQIRKITNFFKHTNIKIAFKCNDTIAQLLKPANNTPPPPPYDRSGIYSLTCCTCQQAYVGQTSRASSSVTKSIQDPSETITHLQHMPCIHSKTDTNMDQ